MELRNLITFLKIVETGSFSKAAEQLLYSQSTVTVQMQQLEEELQVQLFDRIGKKVFVTQKGWELQAYAQQMAELAQKISCIGSDGQELHGELRILSFDSLMVSILPDILLEYHKRHPAVTIVVKTSDSMAETEEMLSHGEADLGFFFSKTQEQKNLISTFSRKARIVFAALPDHPLAKKKQVSLSEIAKEPLVISNKHDSFTILNMHTKSLPHELKPTFDIWNTSGAVVLVREGAGIGVFPQYLIADAESKEELCVLDVPEIEDLIVWVQALHHRHKVVTPQMEAFFSLLEEIYPFP